MLKVVVDYPTKEQERMILDMASLDDIPPSYNQSSIIAPEEVFKAREVIHSIYMDDKIKDYIVALIHATRDPSLYNIDIADYIETGCSPRATLSLKSVAKSLAYLSGRGYVTPDDVKSGALDVMRHRIRLSYEAEAESITSEDIIRIILDSVPIP